MVVCPTSISWAIYGPDARSPNSHAAKVPQVPIPVSEIHFRISPGPPSSGGYNRLPASSAGLSLRMIPSVTEMPRSSVHRGHARHQWRGLAKITCVSKPVSWAIDWII